MHTSILSSFNSGRDVIRRWERERFRDVSADKLPQQCSSA